jgi:hypothetical protein
MFWHLPNLLSRYVSGAQIVHEAAASPRRESVNVRTGVVFARELCRMSVSVLRDSVLHQTVTSVLVLALVCGLVRFTSVVSFSVYYSLGGLKCNIQTYT